MNAKKPLIVLKKIAAGDQRKNEQTGKDDPNDDEELRVILHA
jgi:hypothetical protein